LSISIAACLFQALDSSWSDPVRIGTQDVREFEATSDCRVVKFIDTPGFNDSKRTDSEILEVIGMYLRDADLNGITLTAVIYLQWIHENRCAAVPSRTCGY